MKPKVLICILCLLALILPGCQQQSCQVVATTLPVYQFTTLLCEGTGITVSQLITQEVSCLHDYSLNVSQVQALELADLVVISGGGLEEFMEDLLDRDNVIDSSLGIDLLACEEHDHEGEGHHHEQDSHIWLSPANGRLMAGNIAQGLTAAYPQFAEIFASNLEQLTDRFDALEAYGQQTLSDLSCRELITFHDGFGYFAEAFDLHILEAIEEESGSEASAQELKEIITLVREHQLPAVFTETNGSVSAADIIHAETGASIFTLDMAMAGDDYFQAMYHNIDTIQEAMG